MIALDIAGPIARITLDAPQRHNALDRAGLAQLARALEDVDADPAVRVLVLTGEGRSFCAGAALGDVAGQDWTENPLTAVCDRLEEVRVPSICALNGGVYGGGVELAGSCDFRIGVTGMKMFVPPAELGIHYPPDGIARVERLLGLQLTRRIFLRAERFADAALLAAGFLDQLVAAEALEETVAAEAQHLAGLAPMAVQGMKRTLLEQGRGMLDRDAARARIQRCFASADHAEGLAAQKARRKPVFDGR